MNLVIIKGRLTKDPEIRTTANTGTKVASFSVAVQRKFKNQNGEFETDFFNVTSWGNQAGFVESYFKKGQEIIIEGRMVTEQWEEGEEKKSRTICVIDKAHFCGSKSDATPSGVSHSTRVPGPDGFEPIPDGIDEEIPFS